MVRFEFGMADPYTTIEQVAADDPYTTMSPATDPYTTIPTLG